MAPEGIKVMLDQAHFIGAPNVRGEFPVLDIDHEFLFNVDLETAVLLTRTRNITDKTSLVDLCSPPIDLHPQQIASFYAGIKMGGWTSNIIFDSGWQKNFVDEVFLPEPEDGPSRPGGTRGTNKTPAHKPNKPRYSGPPHVSMNIIKARDHRKK